MSNNVKRIEAPDAQLFAGQTVMVTGAGAGIGRQLALDLASLGAELVLLGRTQAKLEAVDDEIRQAGGKAAVVCPCDLATLDEEQAEKIAEGIDLECGKLDALVHNAGILGPRAPIANVKLADWAQVMQVNLTAPYLLTRALLPVLRAGTRPRILFTSSGVARPGRAYWGPYAVSKAGTENLCEVLAAELTDTESIRVNCVNPGATRTAMRAAAYPAEDPATLPAVEEKIPAYRWLLADHAEPQSGAVYHL